MTYEATIALGPVVSAERIEAERKLPGRSFYNADALSFLPIHETVPLLIDHDPGREIGRVRSLHVLDTAGGRWWCAVADVTAPPSWLRKGTGASISRWDTFSTDRWGYDVVRGAFVKEVSVLSPGVKPAEPGAQVVMYREALPYGASRAGDEAIRTDGRKLRRQFASPVTFRGRAGEVIRNNADGTQTIWLDEETYREDVAA